MGYGKFKALIYVLCLTLVLNVIWTVLPQSAKAAELAPLQLEAKSAVLMEVSTGQVLYNMNADIPLPPASMSKMMTEYIVVEQIKQGKLSWDQPVNTTANAAAQIGSRIFLAEGDQHTVKELYIAMAVGSANDATVALAEHISGTEQSFVKLMNDTAKKIGLSSKSHFINATGLSRSDMPAAFRPESPDKETLMTALDAAKLAYHIVTKHPEALEISKIPSYKFRERDTKPMINYNWMLEGNKDNENFRRYVFEGMDGLKTGHTNEAGYCFTGTAERNGMRLISVVMGTKSEPKRFIETKKVMDYGFNNFEKKTIIAQGAQLADVKTVKITKGKENEVPVTAEKEITVVLKKGDTPDSVKIAAAPTPKEKLVAPIKKGQQVGTVTVTYGDTKQNLKLIASEDMNKAGGMKLFFRAIGDFFRDLFSGIKDLF
ncbi:D-alanyl-D-alanine carboxypeptidase family protein [Paenibacillus gansuensis]|uniref:serine-type D-Ala-D-Ala carboxypeptidase n=1 Tax=Paenibacillus gansuensis TaxID=306542 RepID=A0ABW5PHZ3_9BACL